MTDRKAEVEAALAVARSELDAAKARWDSEKLLVDEVLDLRAKLRAEGLPVDDTADDTRRGPAGEAPAAQRPTRPKPAPRSASEAAPAHMTAEERAATLETLKAKSAELAKLQGERPLILPSVDRIAVGVRRAGLDRHSRPAGCWQARPNRR